jgi:phosphatidylethanolamine-binding protein (PEBP) family uncharacterized protein
MKPSGKYGLYAAIFCILALVAAGCMAPASPGTDIRDIEASGTQTGSAQELQKNTSGPPPDAAIAACGGKTCGDNCQFMDREGMISGTCDEKPGVLACAPARSGPDEQASGTETSPQVKTPPPVKQPSALIAGTFVLTSEAGSDVDTLPDEYSCDGAGASPALSWSGTPAGTKEFALMMTTLPVDGSTRWNWVLYHIPATATGIAQNGSSIGILGTGSHGSITMYDPPCPQGPGAKLYTFTLYALSASPELPANPEEVTGPVLTSAISSITLDEANLNLYHDRGEQG